MLKRLALSLAILCLALLACSTTAAAGSGSLGSRGANATSLVWGGGTAPNGNVWGGKNPKAPPSGLIWQNIVPPPPPGRLAIWNWRALLPR